MRTAHVRWLEGAPPGWDALVAADPAASPSHRPAVWEAFAAALPGHAVRVLALEADGALVGGVPLMEVRRGPLRWLHALPLMLPAPPLAAPGWHAALDRVAAGAVLDLARERGIVGGSWSWYRPAEVGAYPQPQTRDLGETRTFEASIVELGAGLDAALARVGRKERAALRRPRADLAFSDDPAPLEPAYALHVAQSRRWGGHRLMPLELSRRLLGAGGDPAVARLFSLADAHGVVSAALALDGPHETFVWWSGTHPEGRTLGAFTLLLWRIVEWAAARGRARVNLGASSGLPGVASFKRSLGVEALRYPVLWLDTQTAGIAGRALRGLQARRWRGRARGDAA
jgi:hypothetical protein